jgi:hypothetical protein
MTQKISTADLSDIELIELYPKLLQELKTRGIKVSPTCEYQKNKKTCDLYGWKQHNGKLYCTKHYKFINKKKDKQKEKQEKYH